MKRLARTMVADWQLGLPARGRGRPRRVRIVQEEVPEGAGRGRLHQGELPQLVEESVPANLDVQEEATQVDHHRSPREHEVVPGGGEGLGGRGQRRETGRPG
ncbi:hypothetical protein KC19_VG106200 [Ceratodon purpureus]|uniref:Uncharacterized protein n=1 Tax=Ceratodon purpureus TaxID=3225 RepID=A0A8T0HP81_CERPU|nr:hypothetical protein KC19_VG106200 [Ceratodon purpureus]